MIRMYGLEFHEDEIIKDDTILKCHPQKIENEAYGVPLRLTAGYQCFYDKLHRTFAGLTFYAPPKVDDDVKFDNADLTAAPADNFSYVLASFDGKLHSVNGEIVLSDGEKAMIYSHFNPTKTSGSVKKGAIIGRVAKVPGGYGYGVSVRAYKGGSIWDIERELYNIKCLE